jgi:hypothetical protein
MQTRLHKTCSQTHGQTLAELALILPVFCSGLMVTVQLICFCHNMIELQRMAMVAIDHVSVENYRSERRHYWFHSLRGHVTIPRASYKSEKLQPWRPFKGIATITEPGRLVKVRVSSDLLPRSGFGRVLAPVTQCAFAETMLEPRIPSEK